jgi:hypothetical protein
MPGSRPGSLARMPSAGRFLGCRAFPGLTPIRRQGAGRRSKTSVDCWCGDMANGSHGGGGSAHRWVLVIIDSSQSHTAARRVDHHGTARRGYDNSYESAMYEWKRQRTLATMGARDHGMRHSWFDPHADWRRRRVRWHLAGTSGHLEQSSVGSDVEQCQWNQLHGQCQCDRDWIGHRRGAVRRRR